MARSVYALLVCAIVAGCAGAASTPIAPASSPVIAPAVSTASIAGTVQTPAGAAAGMNVDIVGSSLRATVGSDNRFSFASVPAGQHRLHFSGAGANAEVALDPLASGEALSVIVNIDGASASIQSGHKLAANETRFEARIASMDAAAGTFVAGDRTVSTSASTVIRNGSQTVGLASLTAATLVEVTGVQGTTAFAARLIDVLRDPQLQLNGTVAAMSGGAAAFEFTLGTRRITGSGATEFKGGSNPSFARLINGATVHVTAADKGAFAEASRIIFQEDETATPGAVSGVLTSVAGTSPALTLSVAGKTVLTNAATIVRRGNNLLPLSALAPGQTLEIDGTLGSGGTITAAKIQIEEFASTVTGTLTAIAGTSPALTLTVGGNAVATSAATVVRKGTSVVTLAALATGQALIVDGTSSGGVFTAAQIQIQQTTASITGTLTVIAGTSPALTLTVGGSSVLTSASTVVRRGTTVETLGALATGQTVLVDGTVGAGGIVNADRIQIEETAGPPAVVVSGAVASISGAAPVLTLTVGGATVVTTASTSVTRGTTTLALSDLATGQSVVIDGTAGSGGIVTATKIEVAPVASPIESFDQDGIVSGLGGTCPSATFTLGGRKIVTSSGTNFVQVTCGTLANGQTLRVKGTQLADGTVAASFVQIKKGK